MKSLRGIRTKWQTHRGSVHPLRLWRQAGKSWSARNPDWIVLGMIGELGCVRGQVLVGSGRLEVFQKEKKWHSAAV